MKNIPKKNNLPTIGGSFFFPSEMSTVIKHFLI